MAERASALQSRDPGALPQFALKILTGSCSSAGVITVRLDWPAEAASRSKQITRCMEVMARAAFVCDHPLMRRIYTGSREVKIEGSSA